MKTNICTSPSQSARLIACGVDPKSADMMWSRFDENREHILLAVSWETPRIKRTNITKNNIPAWSLSRLLSLLPMEIRKDGIDFTMMLKSYPNEEECYRWDLEYFDSELEATAYYSEAPDPIEACMRMVEKLTDNGYKLNEARQ